MSLDQMIKNYLNSCSHCDGHFVSLPTKERKKSETFLCIYDLALVVLVLILVLVIDCINNIVLY